MGLVINKNLVGFKFYNNELESCEMSYMSDDGIYDTNGVLNINIKLDKPERIQKFLDYIRMEKLNKVYENINYC